MYAKWIGSSAPDHVGAPALAAAFSRERKPRARPGRQTPARVEGRSRFPVALTREAVVSTHCRRELERDGGSKAGRIDSWRNRAGLKIATALRIGDPLRQPADARDQVFKGRWCPRCDRPGFDLKGYPALFQLALRRCKTSGSKVTAILAGFRARGLPAQSPL